MNYISKIQKGGVEYAIYDDRILEMLNGEALCGDVVYETLEEAVAVAQGDVEIKLLNNVIVDEVFNIPAGANIVLDLNGHSIRAAEDIDYAGGMITVLPGATLTVNGEGTIDCGVKDLMAVFQLTHRDFANDANPARLVINGGHYVGRSYCICGNGNPGRGNTEIIINGGIFDTCSHNGVIIYNPQENSSVVINGGKLVGCATGIEMRSGNLTVNYGQIEALSAPASVAPNGNGTTATGSAIAICQHTTKHPINLEINGGIIKGYHALYQANPQKNDEAAIALVNMKVNDGMFIANNSTLPVYSENKTGFIYGGRFSHPVDEAYKA